MGRFLFLQNTVSVPGPIAEPPDGCEVRVVEQYDFVPADLSDVDGVLFCQHLDERHLLEHLPAWEGVLASGGALAVNGPVARPFLERLPTYRPEGDGGLEGWVLKLGEGHPITQGVSASDLTWRRGVVGFWARGVYPPPPEAVTLTRFRATGAPVDWAWRSPEGGRLFVHPGNNVWSFAREPSSAARVYPQLLRWMRAS